MMKRDACLKALARRRTDEIVVSVYRAAFEWKVFAPSPLNYVAVGAMGLASSHGLGLAIGRPDKRVWVLDGDGSLLMNLSTLVTVANQAPKNLIHFVGENGVYEVNGSHPIPGYGKFNFAGMAREAGYRNAYEFSELQQFERDIDGILKQDGPTFVTLKIEPGEEYPMDWPYVHGAPQRDLFRAALKPTNPRS
ncbi:MAG: thiamine pyrophosphate-binding protein [Alphaproteobacteria bacterium]|nr:thiamine pyrophosphate-binding protein [Alphaproteobacteria bacterium]